MSLVRENVYNYLFILFWSSPQEQSSVNGESESKKLTELQNTIAKQVSAILDTDYNVPASQLMSVPIHLHVKAY